MSFSLLNSNLDWFIMKIKQLVGCLSLCFMATTAQAGYQYRIYSENMVAAAPTSSCVGPSWATSVSNGGHITAYQSSTVPYGSSCVSEVRNCANGVLSGTFEAQSCAVTAQPTAVFVDGAETPVANYYSLGNVYIGSSSSVMAGYVKNTGTVPVSLTSAATISGTYASLYATPGLSGGNTDCASGVVLNSGDICEFGLQFTPSAPGTANTPISISYTGGSATKAVQGVGVSSSCTLPWGGTTNTGTNVPAYQTATVPYGSTCVSETRHCTNTVLDGSFQNGSCSVSAQPVAIFVDGSEDPVASYYNLGNVYIGSSSSVMAGYVKNTGTVPVSLTSTPVISGTYASLYTSSGLSGGIADCASGVVLNVGDKCEFGMQFTPSAVGTANTPLSISYAGGTVTKAVQGVGVTPVVACADTSAHAFTYTGSAQSITVPANCTTATIKAWGAAGGSNGGLGGAGGYATATYTVAAAEQLTIVVGVPGQIRASGVTASANYTGTYSTGGLGGKSSGGGLVAVSKGGTLMLVAGSGGGGFGSGSGGGGGGTSGQNGVNGTAGGYATAGGGTSSAGGVLTAGTACGAAAASYNSGGYLTGGIGNADYPGYGGIGIADDAGGGGAGYYGGAGGSYCGVTGGGGGSGYYSTGLGYTSGGSLIGASGATPGNSADADRSGAGVPVNNAAGVTGRVVIRFN